MRHVALATPLAALPDARAAAQAASPAVGDGGTIDRAAHPLALARAHFGGNARFADRGAVAGLAQAAPVIRWRDETGRWSVPLLALVLYPSIGAAASFLALLPSTASVANA